MRKTNAARRWTRTLIVIAVPLLVGLVSAPPASAYPEPPEYEWWFASWQLKSLVWPISEGAGSTVAVIDSGVQADLPELADAVLPGVDLVTGGDGRTDLDDGPVPGHGTAMSALIAAQGTPPTGFLGVAPRAKILPIASHHDLSKIAEGIHYAVDHGAKVINISQSAPGRCLDLLQHAVGYALDHDVVVVAAAGNDGDKGNPLLQPADCAGVLAVGGVGVSGQSFVPLPFSERQPYVTVAAPGTAGGLLKDGQYHTSSGGTSGAAAMTSATVALVRAKFPTMHAREVVQRIIASCRDVDPPGTDVQTGYGLIRPNHALTDDVSASAPNPVFDAYDRTKATKNAEAPTSQGGNANVTPSEGPSHVLPVIVVAVLIIGTGTVVVIVRRRKAR